MPWLLYVAASLPLNARTMSRRNKIATEKISRGEFATAQCDSKSRACESNAVLMRTRCEALGAGTRRLLCAAQHRNQGVITRGFITRLGSMAAFTARISAIAS